MLRNVAPRATKAAWHLSSIAITLLSIASFAPLQSLAVLTGVTTAQATVRAHPNGSVVDSLNPGTSVAVLKVVGEWIHVMYLSKPGAKGVKTGWVRIGDIRLSSRGVGSRAADCESEYKTGAEVCVTVTDTDLSCHKDFSGEYYRECEVTVEYDVRTNYAGGSYLDVDVECEVEISYTGREMYSWRSDSASEDQSHTLYAHGSESESLSFDFSFSSYNEVTRVKIGSATCEIESVNLW